MNTRDTRDRAAPSPVTPELIAEAAAWVSILHGPRRTTAVEQGFSQWLKTSPAHARAFEEATGIWEESGNLPRPLSLRRPPVTRSLRDYVLPIAASVALVALALVLHARNAGIATAIGEQRVLALDDGSRVILNTNSSVRIAYSRDSREVELKAGEALFEVAKNPGRPFVVTAGSRKVHALGTAFVVRRERDRVAVTLVEGSVKVTADGGSAAAAMAPAKLLPGERLTLVEGTAAQLDRPALDKLLAWQRREVAFDNTALADAIAEMNRYSRVPLVIEGSRAEEIHVTGLFRAGDSLSFARAVSHAFEVGVVQEPERIRLEVGRDSSPTQPGDLAAGQR